MKKLLTMILALVMLLTFPVISEETEEAEIELFTIEGIVSEITGEYILIENADIGSVQANITADTVFTNELPVCEGQYVFIAYNGMMTRSLPPQISAFMISNFRLTGDILSVSDTENAFTMHTEMHGEVVVNLPETIHAQDYKEVESVMVYFDGAMMLSLPAQISGMHIVALYKISGTVLDASAECIMIDTENGEVQVNLHPDTEGEEEYADGDKITVTYNGMMTRSFPGQISAIHIEKEA